MAMLPDTSIKKAHALETRAVAAIHGHAGVEVDATDDGCGLPAVDVVLLEEAKRGLSGTLPGEVDAASGAAVANGRGGLVEGEGIRATALEARGTRASRRRTRRGRRPERADESARPAGEPSRSVGKW